MRYILFELKEGLLIAFRALRTNKVRTSLTMLGIFIGITVVVLMSTAIKGIDNSFQSGISLCHFFREATGAAPSSNLCLPSGGVAIWCSRAGTAHV